MKKEFTHITPEEAGIPSDAIVRFLDRAERLGIELHSMALLRHGKICAEGFFAPYAPQYLHPMFSFGKSLTSTAIGFAVQEGSMSLSDRLVDIFPDKLPDPVSENLALCTIHDLLIMGCGHETEPQPKPGEDWIKVFLSQEFKYRPGTMFQYNTPGTNMLSAALYRKTGFHLTEYLRPRLLDPLGIGETQVSTLPDGTEAGGAGFKLHTDDMVRFVTFLANRGVWEGRRLLGEDWFDLAVTRRIDTANEVYHNTSPDWRCGYGYQFWRCRPEGVYRADGMFGQFGIVMTKQDAVLILTETTARTQDILDAVWDILLPAMQETPLPENIAAHAVLKDRLSRATLRPFPVSVPLSFAGTQDGAAPYTGQVYTDGGTSDLDFRRLASSVFQPAKQERREKKFRFTEAASGRPSNSIGTPNGSRTGYPDLILQAETETGDYQLQIGMNGDFSYTSIGGAVFAAAGRWRSLHVLDIYVCAMENLMSACCQFRFESDQVIVQSDLSPALGVSEPPAILRAL